MRLPFSDTSDSGQTVEDTETDEHTVDYGTTAADSATVQPTFTPAARVADDDMVSDDGAETPTVVESADAYPAADETDEAPAVADTDVMAAPDAVVDPDAPATSYAGEPATSYTDNEPVTGYSDDETDEPAGRYADADAPVVRYTEVDTFETAGPADDSADVVADEPATDYDTSGVVSPADTSAAPVTAGAATVVPVTDEPETVSAAATPAAVPNLDQPLLSGDTELLSQWQRVQADFVDDPKVAVAGAADLVEQAGQALVDALQQRQRQMRTMWDHSADDSAAAPGKSNVDTEELRQMMQRYRALFNQLYQPV